jgi:hypothetical protein
LATITINIPDAVVQRVLDAFADRYCWTAESGLTKAQFAKAVLVNLAKETVRMYEGRAAVDAAKAASDALVDADIIIT